MTATQLAKYVGNRGTLTLGPLKFPVMVADARKMYGRFELKITPAHGSGEQWVTHKSVKLDKEGL